MITDKKLDEAMVEAARFLKAAKALRAARKTAGFGRLKSPNWQVDRDCQKQHSACKRASLDPTRKLADLRGGR